LPSLSPKRLFAANVRRLRLSAGLSQEALADRAGLHRTYISSIERGERNVSLANIFALAEALGVDPRDLLAPDKKAGGK
jgi:transcriptional regulator with XRE-family HTH domain